MTAARLDAGPESQPPIRATLRRMDASTLAAIIVPIIGTVIAVGLALATLIMRSTARLDADRRAFQSAMDTFRAEMQRLAERQSHVEGRC